jgi:hypothetical protein
VSEIVDEVVHTRARPSQVNPSYQTSEAGDDFDPNLRGPLSRTKQASIRRVVRHHSSNCGIICKANCSISPGGVMRIEFEAHAWDSLISFEPGIPVERGGTLELMFTRDVDVATQVGRTLRIFDWSGVSPVGEFLVASPYAWDVSRLYTTGEVTLAAVPEPGTAVYVAAALVTLVATCRRRDSLGAPRNSAA